MAYPNRSGRLPARSPSRRKRRRWQLGIRTALVLTAACAVLVATVGRRVWEANRLFETTRALSRLNCQVQFDRDRSLVVRGLRALLGEDRFVWDKLTLVESEQMTDDDLEILETLTGLRVLRLSNSPISDRGTQHLVPLAKLEELTLSNTRISKVDFTRRMAKLRWLDLSNTPTSDLSGLVLNPQLSELKIPLTDIGGDDLEIISNLKHLAGLDISYAKVNDQDLEHLRRLNLTRLTLVGIDVSDAGLKFLSEMTKLHYVDASHAPITGRGLAHIRAHERFNHLFLKGTDLDDEGLQVVGRFTGLYRLSLEGTRISDAGLNHLQNLRQLTQLNLAGTKIDGAGLKYLRPLKRLEIIDLHDTPVTDEGLSYLHDLPKLILLDASNSQASQTMLDSLPTRRVHPRSRRVYPRSRGN